jgi:hypothetical protein
MQMINQEDLHEGQLRTWVNGAFCGMSFIVLRISTTIEHDERSKVCRIVEGDRTRIIFFDVVKENSYIAA